MFIREVAVKNFRLFKDEFVLGESHIAVPNGRNLGSGLTVIVGENGVGKSSILDAISFPLISYRAETIQLSDFTDIQSPVEVLLGASSNFTVKKTMSGDFEATGFRFIAKLREQNSTRYAVGTSVSEAYFVPVDATSFRQNSPDLRVAVDNPFAGSRFNENDCLFIDKNRTKILESGTYSPTRFDRLLDNLNFLYLKANNNQPLRLHESLDSLINSSANENTTESENTITIENESLNEAFQEFKDITGYTVELNFIEDALPYKKAFLGFTDLNHKQIPIEKIGSGYQMFLALICQQKISLQSGKKLIMLIDEVELHLHPKLQKALVDLLLKLSKDTQIILTSHSPELLKDLQRNKFHKIISIVRSGTSLEVNPIDKFVLPLPTVSETNYVAFNLASMEYFIELYNYFGEINGCSSVTSIDRLFGVSNADLIEWKKEDGTTQSLSTYSCIRNKFHHPSNTLNDSKFTMNYNSVARAINELRQRIVPQTRF